ncbi:hypothetical protein [Chitinophaga sp.]|uniref:BP74-related protein n=1 Tax=Chitinophaga sp. TaxID=1869181 RepID=UPI0031DE561A
MSLSKPACLLAVLFAAAVACNKNDPPPPNGGYRFFQVAKKVPPEDWRDSAFVVATRDSALLRQIDTQLTLPVAQRKIVNGALVEGGATYNKNASHTFKWHFKEDDWALADVSAEIFDGRPYTDVDVNLRYWIDTVKRFAPWGFYIRQEVK